MIIHASQKLDFALKSDCPVITICFIKTSYIYRIIIYTAMCPKNNILFVILLTLLVSCSTRNKPVGCQQPMIIPQPVSLEPGQGVYTFDSKSYFSVSPGQHEIEDLVSLFSGKWPYATEHIPVRSEEKAAKHAIRIEILPEPDAALSNEGYKLDVHPQTVFIQANSIAGAFYGLQTLSQLLPVQTEAGQVEIPCLSVVDYPRFAWRGLLLDVSRHFFPKEFVLRYIDQMAMYKFNVLQLHLTDDQGWRVQINALPRLTEVGAWRAERVGDWWHREPQLPGEKTTYGGYYTHKDLKQMIEYARQRNIMIVPEIEVPGHGLAAIAAYPELSCTGKPYTVNVGNKFYGIDDNAFCAGNDAVFNFLESVIAEVAEIFPSPYIHIGGDECYRGFWEKCPKCKKRMADENLKNLEELQSYFVKRVEKIAQAKGKKIIGWDEILEGGLAPDAVVMSWRGMSGGIKAIAEKHHVIMTPERNCYLDLYQGEPSVEPVTYSMCRLSDSYSFEPVPEGVDPQYVMGGQGNLWAESIPTGRHVEYMTWPRALALSEVLWSPKEQRSWKSFIPRVEHHFGRLETAGINYAKSVYNTIVTPVKDSITHQLIRIQLGSEIEGTDIYYTFDGTNPDRYSLRYEQPVSIPKNATTIRCISYYGGKAGRMITIPIKELEKR